MRISRHRQRFRSCRPRRSCEWHTAGLFYANAFGSGDFEVALKEGAKRIIVAHNHPSGDPMPSDEDVTMTKKLVDAGQLINVPLLDHMIVGMPTEDHSGFFGMAASELVDFK